MQRKIAESGPRNESGNPFLPPSPHLTITDIGATHILIFNKYCVVPNHLLLITREFKPQVGLLAPEDFSATELTLAQLEGGWMVFYNSGKESGASQPHRHLQLIPDDKPPIIGSFLDSTVGVFKGIIHKLVRLTSAGSLAEKWRAAYSKVCSILPTAETSYSLLFTREWMLMVPRLAERYEHVSFNTLVFAGYLLACYQKDYELLLNTEITQIYNTLGFPALL
ncbi:Phosphorylase [Paramicrosporidium saccamoebae]|uniref:Phosphorylase n=1 Tax=Paramicrosporidium saccamoebae TaxID=1246581 RepID=A0A2H9TG88_9FUNG|nr:Phosphorylase [Paramicrosporidium saccamoebae]